MPRTIRLLLVALAMTAILAGLVGHHVWRRNSGDEIYLDMVPVDPRDILLGHYVVLTTPLHRIDTATVEGDRLDWERGDTIYVALATDSNGSSTPAALHRAPPSGGQFVRGQVDWAATMQDYADPDPLPDGTPGWQSDPIPGTERQELTVRFNLERYYAPRDQALDLEAMRDDDRLRLIVSVGADGGAVIKGLEIDGEARYDRLY